MYLLRGVHNLPTEMCELPFPVSMKCKPDMQVTHDDARGEAIVLDDTDDTDADNPGASNRRRPGVGDSKGLVSNPGQPTGYSTSNIARGDVDLTCSDDEDGLFVAPVNFPHRKSREPGRERPPQPSGKWEWSCSACTYLNAPWADACSMCLTKRI